MSCTNCGTFGEYRRICDYDGYNRCSHHGPPLGNLSYACSPNLGCHELQAAPNHSMGRYTTYDQCQQNCGHSSQHSFDCVGLGSYGGQHHMCVMKHGGAGQYPTRAACLKAGCQGQN
jgi:hypothetical protein